MARTICSIRFDREDGFEMTRSLLYVFLAKICFWKKSDDSVFENHLKVQEKICFLESFKKRVSNWLFWWLQELVQRGLLLMHRHLYNMIWRVAL